MRAKRRSNIQAAIRDAAIAYAKARGLRGSPAYHIAKVTRLPLASVQGFLKRDSKHLSTVEAIADVLDLEIKIEQKSKSRSK